MDKDLNLTDEQFRTLLKMAFYGDWICSSTKLDEEMDQEDKEVRELKDYILKQAKFFKCKEYVQKFAEGDVELKEEVETKYLEKVYKYDEEIFWDNLIDKLVRRDMLKKYGEIGLGKMSYIEVITKEEEFRELYYSAFENSEIDSLVLKEKK